jgi:hypothetical protein
VIAAIDPATHRWMVMPLLVAGPLFGSLAFVVVQEWWRRRR